ncbi:MCE family protein [Segetibacter sp. 3557_3]|uniref:MlaD family protein n=1 Tax=Segetibacter sp. 3557_3 TaxID=2547429 RepID=UPI001058FFA7|nr:MlaD family protein [Segetibacter sp. 3557_3]TDH26390.1 MCE family protein [Segetibacter sp. 3557_3]
MKINNETKVGALTAIAITLLILGFNFLKGKSLFKSGNFIYAKYKDTKGLMVSNPVFINGLQVGAVYELEEANKNLDTIIVAIKMSKDLNIPNNSLASINQNPLGGSSVEISLGNNKTYLKSGDTVYTVDNPGLLGDLSHKVTPVIDQVKVTIQTLDSVMRNINSIFDPYTKNNMQNTVANFNTITRSLVASANTLQKILGTEGGMLAASLGNVNAVTANLASNNERITSTLTNLETASSSFSKADIKGTLDQMQTAVATLQASIAKMDSKEGTLGLLLNDKQIYTNLANTTRSLNTLMDDIRINPKRYVSISIFGGKAKAQPLTAPVTVMDTAIVKANEVPSTN